MYDARCSFVSSPWHYTWLNSAKIVCSNRNSIIEAAYRTHPSLYVTIVEWSYTAVRDEYITRIRSAVYSTHTTHVNMRWLDMHTPVAAVVVFAFWEWFPTQLARELDQCHVSRIYKWLYPHVDCLSKVFIICYLRGQNWFTAYSYLKPITLSHTTKYAYSYTIYGNSQNVLLVLWLWWTDMFVSYVVYFISDAVYFIQCSRRFDCAIQIVQNGSHSSLRVARQYEQVHIVHTFTQYATYNIYYTVVKRDELRKIVFSWLTRVESWAERIALWLDWI